MTALTILLFYGSFAVIVMAALYTYSIFYNKRTEVLINKFIAQAEDMPHKKFEHVKMRYWTSSGNRTLISLNCYCDLYLFDGCIAIVRTSGYLFKLFYAPVIIAPDVDGIKSLFGYVEVCKPVSIRFNRFVKGSVDIKLPDPVTGSVRTDVTLQGLTEEQINELGRIEQWC